MCTTLKNILILNILDLIRFSKFSKTGVIENKQQTNIAKTTL